MKKTSKKLISLLLAVLMAMSSLTVGFYAFAAEEDKKVADADAAINAFYDGGYKSNLYLNDTDGRNDEEDAVKKAEAREQLSKLNATIKALSTSQREALNVDNYSFLLNIIQEWITRTIVNPTATYANAADKWATIADEKYFAEYANLIGEIPASYKKVMDVFKEAFGPKYDNSQFLGNFASIDFTKAPSAVPALEKLVNEASKFTKNQMDFADNLGVASSEGFSFNLASPTTDRTDTLIKNFITIEYSLALYQAGVDRLPSLSSYSTFVGKDFATGIVSWKGTWDAESYIAEVESVENDYNEKAEKVGNQALENIYALAEKFGHGEIVQPMKDIYAAAIDLRAGKTISVEKAQSLIDALDAVRCDFYDYINANSRYRFNCVVINKYTDAATLTPQMVYDAASKLETKNFWNQREEVERVVQNQYINDFNKFMETVDLKNITTEVQAQAMELYKKLTGEYRDKIAEDVYADYCTLVYPLSNPEDYADYIANFEKTPVDREAIGGDVIWTEQGVQSAVDGLWSMVINDLGPALSMAGIDLSNGLAPIVGSALYAPGTIEAIFDLYAQLSHDTTNLGPDAMNQELGAVIGWILEIKNYAKLLPEEKYAYLSKTIAELKLTDEDKAEHPDWNVFDKLASMTFSDEELGFTYGDQESFLNTLLAVLRPITSLLAPDGSFKAMGLLTMYVNVRMFDEMDKGSGEYVLGLYARLMPLLEQLGLTEIPTAAEYEANYWAVREAQGTAIAADELVRPIIDAAFSQIVNPILADPLNGLVKVLPRLAYVVENDILNTTVKYALERAGLLSGLAGSLDLSKDFINSMIPSEVDLSGLLGLDIVLTIPELNWAALANACTVEAVESKTITDDYFVLRTGEADSAFTEIFYLLHEVLFSNDDAMNALIEQLAPLDGAIVGMTGGKLSVERLQKWNKADKYGAYNDFLGTFGKPTGAVIPKPVPPVEPENPDNNGGNPVKPTNPNDKTPVKPTNPNIPNTGVEAAVATGVAYTVAAALVGLAVSMLIKKRKVTE